jgi:hypothetical protein
MIGAQTIRSNKGILGVICGSLLVGIPALSLTSVAMPVSQATPRPNPLLETPSNNGNLRSPSVNSSTSTPVNPPIPEQLQPPSATVGLIQGVVNVKLVNQTYTNITYQVIGDTKPRTLSGRSDITLENLRAPITITFYRPDRGFLQVNPQTSEAGMLEVTLSEATNLGVGKTVMTIQKNGNVFLN